MFDKRTHQILEAAIRDFISEGKPVSSKKLTKKHKFGVKDATVRSELNALTESGFLAQPHTSGGRIPTDKGYQYLVSRITENFFDSMNLMTRNFDQLINILHQENWGGFIDQVSDEMKLLGAGFENDSAGVYKSGLGQLFNQLELETKKDFYDIAKDFEMLDEKLERLPNIVKNSQSPQIFIGKKSPITQSEHLSVIVDYFNINGDKFYFAAIGPKRMDYQKNLKYLKQIKESINGKEQIANRRSYLQTKSKSRMANRKRKT